MAKETKNLTLQEEDIKLLLKLKKGLFATHGTLSNIAVVRMALRKLENSNV
jgi:hypothetical protein